MVMGGSPPATEATCRIAGTRAASRVKLHWRGLPDSYDEWLPPEALAGLTVEEEETDDPQVRACSHDTISPSGDGWSPGTRQRAAAWWECNADT